MYKHDKSKVCFAPLYIHTFKFKIPHHLTRSQVFIHDNPNPDKLITVSDKLKYYRFQSGLLQRDVASYIGVDRTTYSRFEDDTLESYPLDKLSKAAELFQIDIANLLDDYNLFLYNNQAIQIKRLRKRMKLTQSEFAKHMDVSLSNVKRWEQNKIKVQRNTFEKLSLLPAVNHDSHFHAVNV